MVKAIHKDEQQQLIDKSLIDQYESYGTEISVIRAVLPIGAVSLLTKHLCKNHEIGQYANILYSAIMLTSFVAAVSIGAKCLIRLLIQNLTLTILHILYIKEKFKI
jgi:hypothetical protein